MNNLIYSGATRGPQSPYIPSSDLVEAVNIALILQRPLLLEGEPGCGKSSLAMSIASELSLPFYRWDIRSSSKVQDGLYVYDPPLMFDRAKIESLETIRNYVHFGPIGQAFLTQQRAVVLIDEIDKANADFSDDLLATIDSKRFYIPEAQYEVVAVHQPIIVVTNNQSKYVLSEGFLRACIFHYVGFPSAEHLFAIAHQHFAREAPAELIERAIDFFLLIRHKIADLTPNYRPSVREFLDWLKLLSLAPKETIQQLQNREYIPYHQVLLKFGAYNYMHILLSDNPVEAMQKPSLTLVRKTLLDIFSEDEFRTLCFDMGHRYDKLSGESLEGKMREFLSLLERQNRVEELFVQLTEERPNVDWHSLV